MSDLYQRLANLSQTKRALLARRLERLSNTTATIREGREPKRLVGYIVARAGETPTAGELRSFLSEKLPDYMIPNAFVMLESLPLTPNGKLDRRALPDPDGQGRELAQRYVEPRTATEEMLCGIWAGVLKLERVGVEDNFFELGGHSLLATQVTAQVREVFGVEITLRSLFEQPTIAAFAAAVESGLGMGQGLPTLPITREAREAQVPLSFAQRRLWFLYQLAPENPFYNMTAAVSLKGKLNKAALERTLNEIVRRHEALRTNFVVVDGQPAQSIAATRAVTLATLDIGELPVPQREAEVQRLTNEEAVRPFDLARDPLLRVSLLRLSAAEHILLITLHHIISDGWSVEVFINEVAALYEAFSAGADSPLAELPIQYADYAQWQRRWLQGEILERQLAYWKRRLADLQRVALPTDNPRPLTQTFRGAVHTISLSPQLSDALNALSRREGVTLFMTLLAAFKVQLYRYTSQPDIVVGTPIANRQHNELKDLIGFFVNTLVMRTDLSGNPGFLELLQRVREVALGAYTHQDLPFERLVEELQPARDAGSQPLFQIAFVLQTTPRLTLELPDLNLRLLDVDNRTAKFDLGLELWQSPDGLKARFEYSTDLFNAETIARMSQHFQLLLQGITSNPGQRISELPLLTQAEQQLLLHTWNDTRRDFPSLFVHQLFEQQVERTPDAPALVFEDQQLTYRELNMRANRLARHLRELGVRPESLVGIMMQRSPEMVISLLAVLKAGGAYLPLDPEYPQERLSFMLADAGVRVILTTEELRARAGKDGAHIVCLDKEEADLTSHSAENVRSEVRAENLAYVIYTSGSTGQPNGVLIQHRSLSNLIHHARSIFLVDARSRILHVASFSFDAATLELFLALTSGARLFLTTADERLSPHNLHELISREALTSAVLTPSLLKALDETKCQSLRVVSSGAERLTLELARRWTSGGRRLINCYGPTEATVFATYKVCAAAADEEEREREPGIGRGIENVRVYILDGWMGLVPVGVEGEIYIGGAGVGRGYLGRAEQTAERYMPDGYGGEMGGRMYRTGDIGRWREDGSIEYVGRRDEQVKVRGQRVELGEVEGAIGREEGVRECVVTGREGEGGEVQLVAYVVADKVVGSTPGASLSVELQDEQVTEWETVFNQTYQQADAVQDPTFNIIGWKSSYTGLPIPDYEMREWVDSTVEQLLSLGAKRVLEIGCGSGLLLFPLAPRCVEYRGTDFSEIALRQLREQVRTHLPELPADALLHREADDFEGLQGFDLVVINSVIQYFPNVEYLLRVLEGAINAVEEEGFVYVGDVRSLPLLEPFYASIELSRAATSLPVEELRRRVQRRINEEEELVVDPRFFGALKAYLPRISHVEITPKHGQYHNELTRFRYQVVIHVGSKRYETRGYDWRDWQKERLSLTGLRNLLLEQQPPTLALAGVANARLTKEVGIIETLARIDGSRPAGEARELIAGDAMEGIDPDTLWQLGDELSYAVNLSWSRHDREGRYDLLLRRRVPVESESLEIPSFPAEEVTHREWREYANDPLRGKYAGLLARRLRARLKEKLPDYMIPVSFVMLDELPLTPSGKLDRRALPAADGVRPVLAQRYVEPRTATEEMLCGIWARVLRIERVGVEDNFFELGGHSLLATQVTAQVREVFGVEIALRSLFEQPTIAGLSKIIEDEAGGRQAAQAHTIKRVGRDGDLPLSFAQHRLWFLDQLTPESSAYNIPIAVRLRGNLNIPVLEQTLNEVVRRHESLRTSFTVIDSQPLQLISDPTPFHLPLTDLSQLPTHQRQQTVQHLASHEASQPFNLSVAPLLRASLLRLHEDEHVLLLTMHHIVSDGWSMGVLVREVAALYRGYLEGKGSPLGELEIQYGDYAVWQRERLAGEMLEGQLKYWREQLGGAPPVLELPTDRPRPAVQSYRGGEVKVEITEEVTGKLKALSREKDVTLFMLLLAAFDVLLWRWSGAADLVIGTPIANRTRAELEGLIGFFVNTLALRVKVRGEERFSELAGRVREVCLGGYGHQDVPFEKLVEVMSPEREMSHTPVFQVMLMLQNAPREELQLPGLTLSSVESENPTSKFDLTLLLEETGRRLRGGLEYNADLFDEATIRRMAGHFQTLLEGIVDDAERSISELPLLTAPEREQLLIHWNATEVDYPNQCAHELFEQQVERTPDALALVFEGQQLTYRELNNRANRLAHHLRELGVRPESLVGIMMERSVEMIVSLLGVLKAGGAYVPLDPEYPQERRAFMFADAGASVLLTQARLEDVLHETGARVVCVDREWAAIEARSVENPASVVNPENLAYVIYTSGSTGNPKGVAMQHRPLFNLIEWQHRGLKLSEKARTLQVSSLSFDASFNESFATWRSGGTLILISGELRRDPEALLRFIAEQKAERLFLPFVTLQQLADAFDAGGELPSSLREILSTAEQLHITQPIAQLFERLDGCTLYNEYGPSESHVVTAYKLAGLPSHWDALPPIGVPIANTQIYLLDSQLRPTPAGVPGELYIGGVNLARGYLKQPGATAEKFIPNPFGNAGARLYKTGDLARYLPDGNIKYLGRIDNQIKIHGFRIEPGEIESVLAAHEEVREAVVVARGAKGGGQRLLAYIVAEEPQSPPGVSDLRAHLKKRLPEYMIPSAFVVLDEMPLTPSGKVDRRALPEPAQFRPEIEREYVAPRSPAEELLAEMWARVLKLERVGIYDNFFELGGHSLLATQLVSQVRRVFRVELPLRRLFEEPTVSGLLGEIAQAWGDMEIVEEIARTLKAIEQMPEETVKTLLSEQ